MCSRVNRGGRERGRPAGPMAMTQPRRASGPAAAVRRSRAGLRRGQQRGAEALTGNGRALSAAAAIDAAANARRPKQAGCVETGPGVAGWTAVTSVCSSLAASLLLPPRSQSLHHCLRQPPPSLSPLAVVFACTHSLTHSLTPSLCLCVPLPLPASACLCLPLPLPKPCAPQAPVPPSSLARPCLRSNTATSSIVCQPAVHVDALLPAPAHSTPPPPARRRPAQHQHREQHRQQQQQQQQRHQLPPPLPLLPRQGSAPQGRAAPHSTRS